MTILVSRPCIIPWCHALVSRHLCDPMVSRHWDHAMVPCHWYRLRKDFHFSCSNLFLNGKSQSSHLIHFSDPRVGQGGTVTVETTTAPPPPNPPSLRLYHFVIEVSSFPYLLWQRSLLPSMASFQGLRVGCFFLVCMKDVADKFLLP